MARGMVRRVRHAERRATHGRPRPAHPARGRPCDYDYARVWVVAGEWVCVLDGARGMQAVRCGHVWRSHDRLRAAERRCGRGCQYGTGVGSAAGRDKADVRSRCLYFSIPAALFPYLRFLA